MSAGSSPMVSVRIPAYNHEKYINECLDSVLNQTFQDFEIIITDDGSKDNTVVLIEEYNDPRIKLNVFEHNRGCAVAVADCVQRSSGKYIANLCSDDVWEPDKLEKQMAFLEKNHKYDAVFTKVKFIDENSSAFKKRHGYLTAFECENRSREQWLNHFFYHGNCLCIPSVLIKKDVYEQLGFQDKRMASLLDFDLWVRFCLDHELYILDEKLTRFRLRNNNANASGASAENSLRSKFEYKQILNHYLNIRDVAFFKKCFPEYAQHLINGELTCAIIPYFIGRFACGTKRDFQQLWGVETIFDLMGNEQAALELKTKCGFDYLGLHTLAAKTDVYKRNWRQLRPIRALINLYKSMTRERV